MVVATQIKNGNAIIVDGNLYKILKIDHITPGKGNAVVQVEMRDMQTGIKTQKRFRSSEDVDVASLLTRKMEYLYEDSGVYHFMDQENYQQYELSKDDIGNAINYLKTNMVVEITLHDEKPVDVVLPKNIVLKITETDPIQKGVQGKVKPATLETGLVVKVPLFVGEGESVKVNTDTNEYIERVSS